MHQPIDSDPPYGDHDKRYWYDATFTDDAGKDYLTALLAHGSISDWPGELDPRRFPTRPLLEPGVPLSKLVDLRLSGPTRIPIWTAGEELW